MKTYWEQFIDDYRNEIPFISLSDMLRAYYYYCNNDKKNCKIIMKKGVNP